MIKDSGDRTEFPTGAVRDMKKGKGRCDLLPLDVVGDFLRAPSDVTNNCLTVIEHFKATGDPLWMEIILRCFLEEHKEWKDGPTMILEVSKHYAEGAEKYGEDNWQKGIDVWSYIDSAVRHYLKWRRGDTDEPHDRAFCWNILCAWWTCKHKPELNGYVLAEVKPVVTKFDINWLNATSLSACVCCGAPVPEGRQVCWACERKFEENST